MAKPQIIITQDGSHTLILPEVNVSYHSLHGAIAESQKIYIDYGLIPVSNHQSTIKIIELGLGTGLNAALSLVCSIEKNLNIDYTSIEAFPIELELALQLNYPERIPLAPTLFMKIHECDFDQQIHIVQHFDFTKIKTSWEQYIPTSSHIFDIIFYDAFGPGHQANLWDADALSKANQLLKIGGVLTTFCAQGQFKRNLRYCGFDVESLAGPKGKREVIRATKIINI